MSSEKQIEFTKENIDTYLKEVAKEYRKRYPTSTEIGIPCRKHRRTLFPM